MSYQPIFDLDACPSPFEENIDVAPLEAGTQPCPSQGVEEPAAESTAAPERADVLVGSEPAQHPAAATLAEGKSPDAGYDPFLDEEVFDQASIARDEAIRNGQHSTEGGHTLTHILKDDKPEAKDKKPSHVSRTKDYYRKLGYLITSAEYTDAYTGNKRDLFGAFDFLAIGQGRFLGVQECNAGQISAHLRKLASDEPVKAAGRTIGECVKAWLLNGGLIDIISWEKRAKVGNREWFETVQHVTLETIETVESRKRKR